MKEKEYKMLSKIEIDETLIRPVFIVNIEEGRTNKGKGDPYVKFLISDSVSQIKANMFKRSDGSAVTLSDLNAHGIKKEMLVTMTLQKNDKGYVNVACIDKTVDPDVTLNDFAIKAEGSADIRFNNILDILDRLSMERKAIYKESASISDIAIGIYKANEEKIKWSSAAAMMHSGYAGGLMEHTEAMVRNAVSICKVYPDLDEELLVTAAALHDIGKIEELDTNPLGRAEYSPKGICLGHIVLGYSYVDRWVCNNPGVYPEDRVMLLESLILSHQGKNEYGCPIEPVVKEAFMLYYIDEMDAKYQEVKKGLLGVKPGEISPDKIMGIGHKIYNPKEEG